MSSRLLFKEMIKDNVSPLRQELTSDHFDD